MYTQEEIAAGKAKLDPKNQRIIDLLKRTKEVIVFEFEGIKYLGYAVDAVKAFCEATHYPADFHVWLQDNYKVLE